MENEEEDYDDENTENGSVYWECESTAPGSSSEGAEAWYESEWDSNWDEYELSLIHI